MELSSSEPITGLKARVAFSSHTKARATKLLLPFQPTSRSSIKRNHNLAYLLPQHRTRTLHRSFNEKDFMSLIRAQRASLIVLNSKVHQGKRVLSRIKQHFRRYRFEVCLFASRSQRAAIGGDGTERGRLSISAVSEN